MGQDQTSSVSGFGSGVGMDASAVAAAQQAAQAYVNGVVALQVAATGALAVEQKLRGLLTSQQPSQMRTVLLRMMLGLPEDDGALPAADVKEKEVKEAAANKEKQKEATIRKENQQIRAHNRDEKKVDVERRLYQERAKQEVLRSDDRVRKLAQEIKRKQEEAQSMPQHDKVPENVVEVEDDEQPKPVENLFCSILALIVFVFT